MDVHVGSRVRHRRLMLGLSQEKLADGLGLTFQQVQKYEKGKNRIGASRLTQIATVLQTTPSFFFDGMGVPGVPVADDPLQKFAIDPVAVDLIALWPKLSSGMRRAVVAVATEAVGHG
jgi:transcriptional regulator with XRE-family HTH domain